MLTGLDFDKSGRVPQGVMTYLGPSLGFKSTDTPVNIEFSLCASTVISAGLKGWLIIPDWLVIKQWVILANAPTSAVVDVWRIPFQKYLQGVVPNSTNSLCNGNFIAVSGGVAAAGAPTGWDTESGLVALDQDDVIALNVNSNTSATVLHVTLQCVRTLGNPQ